MGRIQRLPHNVYTSFPFLSEMLILSGMVLYGDWNWGALAGQATIAGFAPLTAIGLYAAGKRWFSHWTGLLASLVYLTSPWTYRFTIIAYAESGLSCYLFATIFAVLRFADQPTEDQSKTWLKQNVFCLVAGLLAGSAMACKYTGLALVVIPAGLILLWAEWRRATSGKFQKILMVAMIYSIGIFLSIGPWLIKNAVETGNPVYPLAVRIFGGIDRDPDIDAKWRNGHGAKTFESWGKRLADLPVKLADVSANNDWHSPLMFALAPLTLLLFLKRHNQSSAEQLSRPAVVSILWLYVGSQFFIWWVLTHHIDRFYVPMFSAVALLAGIGARWQDFDSARLSRNWRSTCWDLCSGIVIVGSALYGANLMQHGICGFNAGRMKLHEAREIAISTSVPRLKWYYEEILAGHFMPKMKVLFAGEAGLFHAQFPYVYNTVFDHELLEQICVQSESPEHQLRPTEEILAEFRRRGITHIDVCWAEVLRYRAHGSYGYNDFVNPETFAELQRREILGPPLKLPEQVSRNALSDSRKQLIEELHWDRSLITTVNREPAYISAQVFPVLGLAPDRLPGE